MKKNIEKGTLLHNVSLKPLTVWQIGGPAEKLYWPNDLADLQQFMPTLPANEPLTWIGIGSNVLVDDNGIPGTVILTQGALQTLELLDNGLIRAEAGVSCAQVARFAARHKVGIGAEFLAGIPGSIGGALFMNAGCFGNETWNQVEQVETMNHRGETSLRDKSEFTSHYRHIDGLADHEWFAAGYFKFAAGDSTESLNTIKEMLAKRYSTQPANEPCCGSVFRNPPGNYSAKLIESLGLKGYQIGQAQISEKHANFIINRGNASSEDVKALMKHIQEQVASKYDIQLIPEVKILPQPQI